MALGRIGGICAVFTAHSEISIAENVVCDGLAYLCDVLNGFGWRGTYPTQQLTGLPWAFLPDKTAHALIEGWRCQFPMPLPVITVSCDEFRSVESPAKLIALAESRFEPKTSRRPGHVSQSLRTARISKSALRYICRGFGNSSILWNTCWMRSGSATLTILCDGVTCTKVLPRRWCTVFSCGTANRKHSIWRSYRDLQEKA